MASLKYGLVFALVLFLTYVQTGESLRCYSCEGCDDIEGDDITCPDPTGWKCYLSSNDIGKTWDRGCTKFDGQCLGFFTEMCSTCTEDLCNDASTLASTFILTICSFLLIRMY